MYNIDMSSGAGWVYLIRSGSFYKIGRSCNPSKRLNAITIDCPIKPSLVSTGYFIDCSYKERELHLRYAKYNTSGEWFKFPTRIVGQISDELIIGKHPNITNLVPRNRNIFNSMGSAKYRQCMKCSNSYYGVGGKYCETCKSI